MLIVTGILSLIILAGVLGLIYYLTVSIRSRKPISIFPSPKPSPSEQIQRQEIVTKKTYQGKNFTLSYPKTWSILTCANSQNFEFDPENNTDQNAVQCDRAVKSVTVLVKNTSDCTGDTILLGQVSVVKSKTTTGTGVGYRWCTNTKPILDITHRASTAGGRATSKNDFSAAIEEMIKTIRSD